MADHFHPVIAEADFPEDGKYTAVIGGWHLLVVRTDDGFHALNDRCPHAASPLSSGRMRRGTVICPLHGARFDLVSGACIGGAYAALRRFPLRLEQGMIAVAVPADSPGMDELPVRLG